MKKIYLLSTLAVIAALSISSCNSNSGTTVKSAPELKTQIDTISYLFGYSNGKNWKVQGLDEMDMKIFIGAMNEAYDGKDSKVDITEGGKVVRDYIDTQRKKVMDENLKKADDFLAKNGQKEGVITTASGLQYKVIKEGTGPKPSATDKVKVNYKGTTIDGEVFDESPEGKPYEQYANRVIKGWTEALQLMPVGSEYQLFIPPSLAYGERGSQNIQPNSALIFDVELLDIIPPAQLNQPAE